MSMYTCNECKDAAFNVLSNNLKNKVIIDREEALAVVTVLKSSWITIDFQKIIYNLIRRIEKELEIE